jgi:PKD repeat protein
VAYDKLAEWNVGAYDPEAKFSFTNTDSIFYFLNNSTRADSFYWDFGDGNTSRDPQPTYHYAMGGSYEVKLIASRCGLQDTFTQTVSFSGTGFHGQDFIHPLKLYPNPAQDHIFIEGQNLFQLKDLMLVDVTGKDVFDFKITDRQRINVSSLSSGTYFLHIIDKQGKWYAGKMIKK